MSIVNYRWGRAAAAALACLMVGQAWAALELDVRCDQPARVLLDGEYVGDAPLILHQVAPGSHRLALEAIPSGERKEFAVYSPSSATTEKIVYGQFLAGSSVPDPYALAPAPVYHYVPAPVVVHRVPPPPPRRWVVTTVPPPPPPSPPRAETRAKTHTRNVLLGLTLASQMARQPKKDRVRQRNVGAGLIILNEILRK